MLRAAAFQSIPRALHQPRDLFDVANPLVVRLAQPVRVVG